jgi:hypothetical protein
MNDKTRKRTHHRQPKRGKQQLTKISIQDWRSSGFLCHENPQDYRPESVT